MVRNKVESMTYTMAKIEDKTKRKKLLKRITQKEYLKNIKFAICPDALYEEGYSCKIGSCRLCKEKYYKKHNELFKKEKEGNLVW
ncbi:hypothetical protein [Inconstantimicrobium porci]|uniref:hypothetical protein n=1 Tax=Inconstantimicrobium porci TaxID=2652291 RepID=UPI00240961CD|nr:hypothetical protein [Inconstantimicrobium porci]MDD6769663.1 hypothetical protein [Inconstantimicrobium porci]